jgi:hypothetical protein
VHPDIIKFFIYPIFWYIIPTRYGSEELETEFPREETMERNN